MLVTLKSRNFQIEDAETGNQKTVSLMLEPDGTLVVADSESEKTEIIARVPLECFPTSQVILDAVSQGLGKPYTLVRALDTVVELDESALSGLHKMPVDIFKNEYLNEVKNNALILCVDIRNFSSFLCNNREEEVFSLIKDFTSNLLSCVNQFAFGCSWYKLLGDGALIIWDNTTEQSVNEAITVFTTYTDFLNEELFKKHEGLGLAGALVTEKVFKYEISAEASQLMYRDYVGYGINLCCRLQGLAKKDELIINRGLSATSFIPYHFVSSSEYTQTLHLLKGLKEEDCSGLFFYGSGSDSL